MRGWNVVVHEKSGDLREMGAGIYLKVNSLLVLKELGALEEALRCGMRLREGQFRDERDRLLLRRELTEGEEAMTLLRGDLHHLLVEIAVAHGVEFRTGSFVESADASGCVTLDSGETLEADLVVGADGYRSQIRESLGLTASLRWLSDGATRVLAPRLNGEREGLTVEYWSGECRLGVVPCSRDYLYLYLMAPESNKQASALPLDKDFWIGRFPQVADILGRIPRDAGRHDRLSLVRVRAWSAGRTALIGDAVHAQPPNLGQGAGMTMANALALAVALDEIDEVPAALRSWEARRRRLSEEVQRWSHIYGLVSNGLFANFPRPRAAVVRAFCRSRLTGRRLDYLWRGGYHAGEITTLR
jgi:2-polyprenyl-6-methoxyphenol hydroxylase-like FAD-dependent oxidoreductase